MTRTERKQAINDCLGKLYWGKHHRTLFSQGRCQNLDNLFGLKYDLDAEIAELKRLLAAPVDEEINARGNTVYRCSRPGQKRYHWDFGPCQSKFGWKQYDTDQDASYFGVWVHIEKRLVLTYCEGDVSLVKCPDVEHLRAELKNMEEFYGPPPPAFIACTDLGLSNGKLSPQGEVTAYYDERPTV